MQIQVNSDQSVAAAEFSAFVEANVTGALQRFGDRIIRVEVHLSDVNGEKFGNHDKRCLIEARPAGRPPVAVTDEAATLEMAVQGAAQKMRRLLSSTFGRLGERI